MQSSPVCIYKLKLNDEKTEFLVVATRQQLAKVSKDIAIRVGPDLIKASDSAKNLGYNLDSTMKNVVHINKLCSNLSLTIKKIHKIRCNIDEATTRTLIQALVTSWLDYCNSLLVGTPAYILQKLQRIQNSATRLVYNKKWVYHITPYLYQLHWLKIEFQIQFKICVLMFKCVRSTALDYLRNLVITTHNHVLHSMTNSLLPISRLKLSQVQNSSFKSVGPRLWNTLLIELHEEQNLETFKSKLKTVLFLKCYD